MNGATALWRKIASATGEYVELTSLSVGGDNSAGVQRLDRLEAFAAIEMVMNEINPCAQPPAPSRVHYANFLGETLQA